MIKFLGFSALAAVILATVLGFSAAIHIPLGVSDTLHQSQGSAEGFFQASELPPPPEAPADAAGQSVATPVETPPTPAPSDTASPEAVASGVMGAFGDLMSSVDPITKVSAWLADDYNIKVSVAEASALLRGEQVRVPRDGNDLLIQLDLTEGHLPAVEIHEDTAQ